MSWTARAAIHPNTWAQIQVPSNPYEPGVGYACGCYPHPHRPEASFHLCAYHDGFDDGCHATDLRAAIGACARAASTAVIAHAADVTVSTSKEQP